MKSWFEKQTENSVKKIRAELKKQIDYVASAMEDLRESALEFEMKDTIDAETRSAQNIYEKFTEMVDNFDFPEVVTYKTSEDFRKRLEKFLTTLLTQGRRFIPNLGKKYKTRLFVLNRALTRIQRNYQEFEKFLEDKTILLQEVDAASDNISLLIEKVEDREALKRNIKSEKNEAIKIEEDIEALNNSTHDLEDQTVLVELNEINKKLKIVGNKLRVELGGLDKPLRKLTSRVLDGKVVCPPELVELANNIRSNPLDAFWNISNGYEKLTRMLEILKDAAKADKLKLKSSMTNKTIALSDKIINGSMKGIHSELLALKEKRLAIEQKVDELGLKEQISDAYLKLSELYEKKGNAVESLTYYKKHITFKDSVQNITAVQNMAEQEDARRRIELNLAAQRNKNQRNISIGIAIALFLIGLLALGLYRRNRFIRKTKQIIEKEKDRSDNLLLNILPQETADELKENGRVVAKKFESVTVLFTDFKGFTHYSENLDPEKLVETIGFYFTKFDDIMEKYGLEKIKTIGDSYMCAGGLPYPTKDHAPKMVQAAFEIIAFVDETKKNATAEQIHFDIRVGINTGPIVAGVVGSKKFSYDIWGDTVNVASRMESMSEPGKINISKSTYELIKSDFDCEYRGEIEAKNRGKVKMYYVNPLKN